MTAPIFNSPAISLIHFSKAVDHSLGFREDDLHVTFRLSVSDFSETLSERKSKSAAAEPFKKLNAPYHGAAPSLWNSPKSSAHILQRITCSCWMWRARDA